ncbi:MAG: dimethyl sulfoxide reductase anchor subunit [Burkholderiaceae bacterium]|nr:dimethyl sulfoxide reductase anchor subunit [Burkholderiaceae bacterium]
MNPAWPVIFFTTFAGWAQGLVIALAVGSLAGAPPTRELLLTALSVALALSMIGLGCSALHLGRPERAWRAVAMWRTSWLSREVIVLPAFIACLGIWLTAELAQRGTPLILLVAIVLTVLLWVCTAMIYVCLTFIREWSHPLTVANYVLLGLASGLLLCAGLGVVTGDARYALACAQWGIAFTALAGLVRGASLIRNARLRPVSTLQSATGIRSPRLKQMSMGMSAGAFNTREFFHGKSIWFIRNVKTGFIVLAFIVPIVLIGISFATRSGTAVLAAALIQFVGLLGERWYFFAEARHPQNLYYQVIG